MKKILIVEDEQRIREITTDYFKASGFFVYEAEDGRKALEMLNSTNFDLVVLDIMMPELDGWSVCKRIRKTSNIPIIMLTARSDEDDKLMGFELGADDYVTKPFSPKVLVARAKSLFNRIDKPSSDSSSTMIFDALSINKKAYEVKVSGETIDLSPKEYTLLLYLAENKGIVLSRESILDSVWGYDYFGDTRVVDTHIKKLRKKISPYSDYIKTVIRAGYKFEV